MAGDVPVDDPAGRPTGSTDDLPIERRNPGCVLADLLRDVQSTRINLQRSRAAGRRLEEEREAEGRLVHALTVYTEALVSFRLPVPYRVRDELRIHAQAARAYATPRRGG